MYQIPPNALLDGIGKLNRDYPLYLPEPVNGHSRLRQIPPGTWQHNYWHYSSVRTSFPLKSLFYPPREKVAAYPGKFNPADNFQAAVILGAKACDIHALKILDKVLIEGEYPEPTYLKSRREHFIVSCDCSEAGESCFCTLMNYQPYPAADFDLNLSSLENSYLIEVGSKKGEKLLKTYFQNYETAGEVLLRKREQLRNKAEKQVKAHNRKFQYHKTHRQSVEKHLNTEIWTDLSRTCVECGICTQVCPTCHCFLIYDQKDAEKFSRTKVWDSCFFAGYSRMAGGLTPRFRLADRFKNRFYHKFDSFPENFGMEACTGCGRCVEGCMGQIDLREVLMELEKRVILRESLEIS